MGALSHVCTYVCMDVRMHVCHFAFTHVLMYACMYVCLLAFLFVCIYEQACDRSSFGYEARIRGQPFNSKRQPLAILPEWQPRPLARGGRAAGPQCSDGNRGDSWKPWLKQALSPINP